MRTLLLLLITLFFGVSLNAQAPKRYTSGELYEALEKLNFLGSALYIAAHPDDENTRLISYLSNDVKAETAYLSLTRGDGGQNLVGPEIRELLGVIRTQELLAARRIDGGQQFFSRANDFGYSKNPSETFRIWDKDQVMADMVWVIRQWQPDIIVNRFDHRTPGKSHGHHTASAMLSYDAFDIVNDPKQYPEQLDYVQPWQPRRLFFNTSWWFFGSREAFANADKSKMIEVNVGSYYPISGRSNNEIAAASRSMHKSQGFGSTGTRGNYSEYLELLKGDLPKDPNDLFEGINTTWTRVKGGAKIGTMLDQILKDFRYENPSASLPALLELRKAMLALSDGFWKRTKLKQLDNIIIGVTGLYTEVVAGEYAATPGERIMLRVEATNRADVTMRLDKMELLPLNWDTTFRAPLAYNEAWEWERELSIPVDMDLSTAYWLNERATLGMYDVKEQTLRGQPETPHQIKMRAQVTIDGQQFEIERPLTFKRNDPVDGEVYRPFVVSPAASLKVEEGVYVFGSEQPKEVVINVEAGRDDLQGVLQVDLPRGWRMEPAFDSVAIAKKGQLSRHKFQLFPPKGQEEAQLRPRLILDDDSRYQNEVVTVEYDHIPTQTILRPATAKIVRIDLKKQGRNIGYLMGAGDDIPASLEQIGYKVTLLEVEELTPERLEKFDAIITGVRAYNTVDKLSIYNDNLLDYVKNGGTLIVQYNTHRRLKVEDDNIGPYPLTISRDRVAVEEAEVRILEPDHPVMTTPNKITAADFDGWVQERGLYFPNEWDKQYTPILSSNDPDEPARNGGLLVTEYGKGHYVYTGYSWFRELPAGVPGAYRIFANLISLGQEARP